MEKDIGCSTAEDCVSEEKIQSRGLLFLLFLYYTFLPLSFLFSSSLLEGGCGSRIC